MKNITIALDEDIARWTRIEAARQELSVSRFIRNLLEENMRQNNTYEVAMRRYLSRPAYLMNETGEPYPSKDEIHDRAGFR